MKNVPGVSDLNDLRVLIVEDEYYLADDLAQALSTHGAQVIGPVASLEQAEEMVERGGFDLAVVDMNLRGKMAHGIADRLLDRGVPFLLTTGYDDSSIPERLKDVARVEKPFDVDRLVETIRTKTKSG